MNEWLFSRFNLRNLIRAVSHVPDWLWPSDLLIITNDGTQGEKFAKLFRIPPSRYRVWFNGVTRDWVDDGSAGSAIKETLHLTDDTPLLLSIGRLADWKRHDLAIQAMPRIVSECPGTVLAIVGDGPDRHKLETLAAEKGICKNVRFLGAVEHSQIPHLLTAVHGILILYNVSCVGNTLLEAMLMGTPTIVWNVGDTPDIVSDGTNGIVLPTREPKSIADAAIRLIRDDELRAHLSSGARDYARANLLSWTERMDREISLVEAKYSERYGAVASQL